MAVMHPKILPESVRQDPLLKNGEVKVYDALSNLSDEFYVYYDAWASTDGAVTAYDRPIDFVVMHAKLGLLSIEVKGGKIRVTENGSFEQSQRGKGWESINPHAQIKKAIYKIIDVLKSDGSKFWFPSNYCVIFPNTDSQSLKTMAKAYESSSLCAEMMPNLAAKIPSMLTCDGSQKKWETNSFQLLLKKLHNVPKENQIRWSQKVYNNAKKKVKEFAEDNVIYKSIITAVSHTKFDPIPEYEDIEIKPKARSAYQQEKLAQHLAKMNHQPLPYDERGIENVANVIQKKRYLRLWEIIFLLFSAVATFVIVSSLLPNSFLKRFGL